MGTKNIYPAKTIAAMKYDREVLRLSFSLIAKRHGARADEIHELIDPVYAARIKAMAKERNARRVYERGGRSLTDSDANIVPQSVVEERTTRLSAPFRSQFGELLGEPRVGFSALDRKSFAKAESQPGLSGASCVLGVCQPSKATEHVSNLIGKAASDLRVGGGD